MAERLDRNDAQDNDTLRLALAKIAAQRLTIPNVACFNILAGRVAKSDQDKRIVAETRHASLDEIAALFVSESDDGKRLRALTPFETFLRIDEIEAVREKIESARKSNSLNDDQRNEVFKKYATQPPQGSALARAIEFGIDPTITFYNMFGLTSAERLEKAGKSINDAQSIERMRAQVRR
jgi:glutathione synthase/RimK-type ligase-like ATP-grasp enzyme